MAVTCMEDILWTAITVSPLREQSSEADSMENAPAWQVEEGREPTPSGDCSDMRGLS